MNSANSIMDALHKWSVEKEPIDPQRWLDASLKLVQLMGDESDKLYQMEQNVAVERVNLKDTGMSVSEAKLRIEASDAYREARQQKALIDRIIETVRLAKHRARLASEEYRAQ